MNKLSVNFVLKIIFSALVTFGAGTSYLAAQGGGTGRPQGASLTITGKVFEAQNKQAVEYARIALYKLPDSSLVTGTVTDPSGQYILENISFGAYFLVADFIGFEKTSIELAKPKGSLTLEVDDIFLQAAYSEIDEVVVAGERNYVDYKIDKKVVNVSQHDNASGGNATDVLENVPSVQVDIDGNVSLRGSGSFTVLIDGKPTILDANDVLQQTPADMIQNIEIITNPSAKYDPEGTAGIINLVMKKNKYAGFSGVVNLNASTWNKYGGDFTFSLRKNKFNYFVSANYRMYNMLGESESYRETYLPETTGFLDEVSDRERKMESLRFSGGFDYNINDKNTFSLSGGIGSWNMQRIVDSRYHEYYSDNYYPEVFMNSENAFILKGDFYNIDAFYQKKFDTEGHKLDANVKLWRWDGSRTQSADQYLSNDEYTAQLGLDKNRSADLSPSDNLAAKIDYSLPLEFGKLEAGIDIKTTDQSTQYIHEEYNEETAAWDTSEQYSNKYEFYRNLYAAYAQFSGSIIGLDYMAGIRLEYSDRNTQQITTDESYPVELFNYYPTLHLSRKLGKTQELQLSYSKRINRPRGWHLNPYPGVSDGYTQSIGNPLLMPEDINAFEFNYLNRISPTLMFSSGLFYRIADNGHTRVSYIDPDNPQVTISTFDNIDRTHSYGGEYMLNYRPLKILNVNVSGNVYNYQVENEYRGEIFNQETVTWDLRANASLNITKSTRFQINGMYRSPSLSGQGTVAAMYFVGSSIRQSLLKDKLNITLSVRDIFNTAWRKFEIENSSFYTSVMRKPEGQIFRLSLSYNINNYKRQQRQNTEPDIDME
jgi:outer membrane receptor protein involved in Fe transport